MKVCINTKRKHNSCLFSATLDNLKHTVYNLCIFYFIFCQYTPINVTHWAFNNNNIIEMIRDSQSKHLRESRPERKQGEVDAKGCGLPGSVC